MKEGCIHVVIRQNKTFCQLYQDKVMPNSDIMTKRCRGNPSEKAKCPEWGLVVLEEEKQIRKEYLKNHYV